MGLNQVYFKDSTLSRLLEWVSGPTRKGVWNEENKWDPFHMTLGSYEFPEPVDKDDLINIFTNEKEWFIQLVKKIPKVANPKRPKDYDWFWDPNQRVILYQKD